jgi:hypothetical protein
MDIEYTNMDEKTINVPLKPGARLAILENVDMDEGGFTAKTVFEGTVDRYVPETHLLEFEDADEGYNDVMKLLAEHDSFQVIHE